jgi:predicted Zn-dependent peptidase
MRKLAALLIALLITVSAMLMAQTIDRTQPPPATPPRPWKPAPMFETHLANGLDVILIDDARIPLVTARLVFPCGNRRDPKALPGLASAVADMLMQGTTKRSFIEIVEGLDGLGGSVSASSGADHIAIAGSIDALNAPALIEVMADVARNAEFREFDLRLYRQNRKQTLARQRSQPSFAANEVFRAALFGDHPYAHIAPSGEAIEAVDRKAVVDFRDTWLVPNNASLLLVGKLPARADVLKSIENQFGSWQKKPLPEVPVAPLPKPVRKLILVDRPGALQADVRMGTMAATQRDAAYFPELAAALIAGSVPMGRMFQDLREKRGFVYDVRTEHSAFDEAGILSTVTQVRNEVAGEAIQAVLDHLDRMTSEPVSARELADAKSLAEGNFLLTLETQAGLLDELMVEKIQKLPPDFLDTWRAHMEAVRAEEVQAAAKRYMSPQEMVVVVVGDASKIGASLAKIGKFEVVKGQ